jgi:hypothetical protein
VADTAFQIRYRQEFIAGFEQRQSLVRTTVVTEADIQAQQAVFLVADSGGAAAVTRGVNGLIPARADDLNQFTATLLEYHDLVRRTGFNLYTSQGDGRRIMQQTTMAVLNRQIDTDIINQLDTATQTTGVTAPASLQMVQWALAILGNNAVPLDGNIFALITPSFHSYLMQMKEFTNVQWINDKPYEDNLMMYRWSGVNFIVHPNLIGKATSTEHCYMYHRNSIGHACDFDQIRTYADYFPEQDYSWARASGFMGSKVLQNTGIVLMRHDGSAMAAGV